MLEWIVFLALSLIAVVTAAGMILTMSMYRAGLALMASFVALAGLFLLLDADLLAAIQIMMNVGGMLVMVLFMVMIMMDPGGEMMWAMKRDMHIPGLAALSMHMPRGKPPEEQPASAKERPDTWQVSTWTCPMHPEVRQDHPGNCPKCGLTLIPAEEEQQTQGNEAAVYTCPMHPEVRQNHPGTCPKCSMTLVPVQEASQSQEASVDRRMSMEHSGSSDAAMHMEHAGDGSSHASHTMSMKSSDSHESSHALPMSSHDMSMQGRSESDHSMNMANHEMNRSGMTPRQYYDMMVDMAMSTAQLPWAIALGIASALLLIILVIHTPWPLSESGPTQDATTMVGELLLSRYMIGFEGAAFLILAGIAGAVILAKRERAPLQTVQAKQPAAEELHQQAYTCPMHPEVRQHQPGTCPTCGMHLIPVEETAASSSQSTHGGQS